MDNAPEEIDRETDEDSAGTKAGKSAESPRDKLHAAKAKYEKARKSFDKAQREWAEARREFARSVVGQ